MTPKRCTDQKNQKLNFRFFLLRYFPFFQKRQASRTKFCIMAQKMSFLVSVIGNPTLSDKNLIKRQIFSVYLFFCKSPNHNLQWKHKIDQKISSQEIEFLFVFFFSFCMIKFKNWVNWSVLNGRFLKIE